MSDKQSSQSQKIPPPSDQEKALMGMVTDTVLPAYMDQAGYSVTPNQVSIWEDSKTYKDIQNQKSDIQSQLDSMPKEEMGRYVGTEWQKSDKYKNLESRLKSLNDQEKKSAKDFKPYTEYTTVKKESPVLEAVKSKYGADSQEYKDAKAKEVDQTIANADATQAIKDKFMAKVDKYLSGDFSVTPDQEKYIQDQFAPIKTAIDKMYEGRSEELDQRYKDFADQVKNTSMKVGDALAVVGEQIQKTGKDMQAVLDSTIKTNTELMKMGIADATGKITKNISQQAIATGRDPSDPEYSQEIQVEVAKQIKTGQLNLAQMQASGEMSIAERTGSGLEEIDKAMARLAEREGGLLENATLQKGQEKASIIQGQGTATTNLEQAKANLRQSIGMGLPTSQISTGSGFISMDQALASQRLSNAAAPFGVLGSEVGYYQGDRRASPTTTTSTPFDWFGAITGAASAGANIYSGVSAAGANNAMADYFGNSGSGGSWI